MKTPSEHLAAAGPAWSGTPPFDAEDYLRFSASEQSIAMESGAGQLNWPENFTLEAWVYPTAPSPFGVIAGRVPVGMALLLGGLSGDNDGTVAVEETRLPGIRDHAVIAATHTGLPFSDEAIAMTARFLRHGRFGDAR